jgi:response regulator RpfG family c-di-GMP phosphodiesterase
MREMAISLARTKRLGRVDPSHIVPYLDALASAAYQPQAEEAARRAIQAFGCELQVDATSTPAAAPVQHAGVVTQEDLAFFESMARAQEMRVPYWQGRIAMQMQLVLDMNEALGRPADPQQLAAAICWHDMGMLLLPDSVLLKDARYDEAEWGQIKAHPLLGSEWLRRMAIYDEAATMVAQHHERVDGNGYPVGLSGGAIHPGAQMIAIADAYFSMSNERSDREHKRSLLRTVAEINACTDSQFDGQVVAAFNQVIRSRAARPA